MTIRRLAILLSIATSLAVVAPAFADSSAVVAGYGGESGRTIVPSGQVQAEVVSAPRKRPSATVSPSSAAPTAAAETNTASKNSLPFTGFDVVWLLIAGVALAGVGFLTRRLASRNE